MSKIILIAGPTASGKSALALELAAKLRGVIVNADSMQVYRDLRIITARPSPDEEKRAPHRLYGHVDAAENYSVGRWFGEAAAALADTLGQDQPAIVVGGTGLYFSTLTRGIAAVPPIPAEIRREVRGRLAAEGVVALHAELSTRDPATAARLKPGDRARVTRALEVVLATGRSLTQWHEDNTPARIDLAGAAKVFLMPKRDELGLRIDARFDAMMAAGALARSARARGAQSRSQPAGDEGARRAVADPSSQGRDHDGRGGGGSQTRHAALHQAAGHLVPQSAAAIRMGRAAACRRGRRGAAGAIGS